MIYISNFKNILLFLYYFVAMVCCTDVFAVTQVFENLAMLYGDFGMSSYNSNTNEAMKP
jgi:hypothetical protein